MLHWCKKRPNNKLNKTEKPRKRIKKIWSVCFQYEGLDNYLGGKNQQTLIGQLDSNIPDTKLGKMD